MKRLNGFLITMMIGIVGLLGISGCTTASLGAPGDGTLTRGQVVIPVACFSDYCTGDETIPLSFARVTLRGDRGDVVVTETDCYGQWQAAGLTSKEYLLEAQREALVLKQVFVLTQTRNFVSQVTNAYTSSQVFIYQVVNDLYPNGLSLDEVPGLVLPMELVEVVEKAYRECRNPFSDPDIIRQVEDVVNHQF